MGFNAALAIINGHAAPMSQFQVVAAEAAIFAWTIFVIVRRFPEAAPNIRLATPYLAGFILLFVWVTLTNGMSSPKPLRDFLVVLLFFMLGALCTWRSLMSAFRTLTLMIIAVSCVEGWFPDLYVNIFQPASYYVNTRDAIQNAYDQSGLFQNAFSYSGRFSFALFDDRRLSSIFLEQVSLANYAMVLAIFAITFWPRLSRFDKSLYLAAIAFLIAGNSSRTGTALCLAMLLGYRVFPALPRVIVALTMPLVLLTAFGVAAYFGDFASTGDDLEGRIGLSISQLAALDFRQIFAGSPDRVGELADNGYGYVIATQSVLGLILFWLFQIDALPRRKDYEMRFAVGAALYVACNLLTSEAIFSMKVGSALWLLAGFIHSESARA
ncbi:putative polymerase [Rhodoblastus acidophilus]|uniref:hypothetical protein n=1 Tax=Rhodoblastus acidophilus TaxID=1074 RepID=UPI0022241475|nr:hypothetical protein [Rhodoblastus acidophilus]MCW2318375.1 putative polymerase [Rhodoblastus acidophilus]